MKPTDLAHGDLIVFSHRLCDESMLVDSITSSGGIFSIKGLVMTRWSNNNVEMKLKEWKTTMSDTWLDENTAWIKVYKDQQ